MKNNLRVLRGGSWIFHPRDCRLTARDWNYYVHRYYYLGFRTVCVPKAPPVKKGDKGSES